MSPPAAYALLQLYPPLMESDGAYYVHYLLVWVASW